ncbi:PIG-L deacetylase family protein [Dictyobacter kobayashii]|uniref:GlcNAc-PI de-N-acetylase n=1 Tax=Dictyobacter kobayashii TaxID=2014872 RepID=A0A402APT7_9CHLR|nr:PIG-L family deacetylase [Dictyobacter kobayashii]GCE21000.1 GlcNAc-PI de-N-acetylase [Dictyobacter kobayashii]
MRLTSTNDITKHYRHIFLAPHLDDIVYSCGGTLGVQVSSGLRPLIISAFAGAPATNQELSPLALQVIRDWGASDAQSAIRVMEERRKEDSAALDYLQADYLWLDHPEAIYRGNPGYYTSKEQLMGGEVHPSDRPLENELGKMLVELHDRLPDTAWYAPLGIGRHIDHQIICSAVDRLVQRGAKVYFYEDFPYVQRDPGALEARIQELGSDFEYTLVEISEMMPLKLEAADMYRSQIDSNFGSREAMHKAIDTYAKNIRPVETIRLERYWVTR